jgi:Male sterility protein
MGEHLLVLANTTKIPLLILRPSIIAACMSEPFPGWTDSIGLAGGIYMITGLGILRDVPGDENLITD